MHIVWSTHHNIIPTTLFLLLYIIIALYCSHEKLLLKEITCPSECICILCVDNYIHTLASRFSKCVYVHAYKAIHFSLVYVMFVVLEMNFFSKNVAWLHINVYLRPLFIPYYKIITVLLHILYGMNHVDLGQVGWWSCSIG